MKPRAILIASVVLYLCVVGGSYGFEITVMESYDGVYSYYSFSSYVTHTAKMETDEVFAKVEWYVNDVLKTTTNGDGDERKTASFSGSFAGNGYGKNYTIKAVAHSENGDTDSDSYTINVRKAVVDYGGGSENDMGYVEVTKCEWNGKTSYGEMFTTITNRSGKTVEAVSTFNYWVEHMRPRKKGNPVVIKDYSPPQPPVKVYNVNDGGYACYCHSDSYTITGKGWWNRGDYMELGVKASVGVKGGSTWSASGTSCYDLPNPNK